MIDPAAIRGHVGLSGRSRHFTVRPRLNTGLDRSFNKDREDSENPSFAVAILPF
jgi:hypothetical protein